jgi:hypothetical protein
LKLDDEARAQKAAPITGYQQRYQACAKGQR